MPEGVVAEVIDGYATLDFVDSSLRRVALGRLLRAAGDNPRLVEPITREGPRAKYRVPEDLAAQAGLIDVQGINPVGDTGFSDALASVGNAGARPTQPSARNTHAGQTPAKDVLGNVSVATRVEPPKRGPGRPKKLSGEFVAPEAPKPKPVVEEPAVEPATES